jgi:hypothetical protein
MAPLILDRIPGRNNFGTNSLAAFRDACVASVEKDPDRAVFYRILADYADRLIDAYHQVPLEVPVVDRDFECFQELVGFALSAADKAPELQMKAVNAMASNRFF